MDLARLHRHRTELRNLVDYQDDNTNALRELHPDLSKVWDELDELRIAAGDVSELNEMEEAFDHWKSLAVDCAMSIDTMLANQDMTSEVYSKLEHISDLLDGMVER